LTDPSFFSNEAKQTNDLDDPDPEIYVPEIKKEEVLKIEGTDYDSRLDSVMDSNGFIKTRINEEVIIQRISHDLYKSSDSGLRELYNNEVRACQIARDKFNQNTWIKVSLNQIDRKLVIQGFNSLGITEKIFTKVLLVLGNSGNLDSKAIGQFGFGFASYTTLSDILLLQTRCLENSDCYSVMAKGGLGFQKLPKPHLEQTGTKLSLTLREDCDHNDLIKMLVELANTSGIKTYLELILDTDKNNNVQGFKSGIHELKQITFQSMFEELNNNPNNSYIKTSLINEDIEIYLAISADKNGYINDNKKKRIFLCNSPIEAKLDRHDYSYSDNYKESDIDQVSYTSVVINLRDERKFKPMPERERLTKEAEDKIKEIIIDLYNNAIQKGIKPCHDFNSWFDHEHKNFIVSNNETITRNFDQQTKELSKLLNTNIFAHDPEKRKTKYDYVPLKQIVEKRSKYNFFIEKRDKRIKNLLNEFRSGHNLVVLSPNHRPYINPDQNNEDENKDTFAKAKNRLMKFGFIEAKQYLIDNKIKATRLSGYGKTEKTYGMISIHHTVVSSAWHDRGTLKDNIETIDTSKDTYENLKQQIIMVKPFADYRRLTREFNSKYYLTVDKKELGLKTAYDIETEITNLSFNTNQGKKTLSEIIKYNKESDIIQMNNECYELYKAVNDPKNKSIDNDKAKLESKLKVLDYIPKTNRDKTNVLYIIDSVDNLFKLGIVLIANNIKYEAVNESLDHYYRAKVEQFEKTVRLHCSNDLYANKQINRHCFINIFEYEDYLLTLKNLEDTVKNITLLKLFKLSRTENNYKELAKDILELNKKCC